MLINCVKEEDKRVLEEEFHDVDDNLEEYHTANELFEMMAKKHHIFDVLENKSLTARDLVILYENIDLGTKLMSNSNECNNKPPNQYVETIIYNDDLDSEDSDICEVFSNEDLHNIFTVNSERIEFLSNMSSFENNLSHKLATIQMKTSEFSNEYEKHFLSHGSYIKEQFQNFHTMAGSKQSDSTVLPMSLLDYVCNKHLENNYNFYMDTVISYVQNTIEQLKRISNGDYLTDGVKEKWRNVQNVFIDKSKENNKIIAISSIHNSSLPVVEKISELKSTWDEIVHSEMDVRSLSKLLQKKIILQIPKILYGSYGFFSKSIKDNLNISCIKTKKRITGEIKRESNVNLLLKLQRPETRNMNHNINSVIVLKTLTTSITGKESCENNFFEFHENEVKTIKQENIKIVELDDNKNDTNQENVTSKNTVNIDEKTNPEVLSFNNNFGFKHTDELGYAIHRLNIQPSVLEESEDCSTKKKKSPTRIRIKSPYENKSFILDEKKRKRLLEIREKRERNKLAMKENCKITKHKYVKGAVMAQSSNSVTKLSITNKSFYNSIYGQTNIATKSFRNVVTEQKQNYIPDIDIHKYEEEFKKEPSTATTGNSGEKYINRSYYLDDADTEIMYLQMEPNCNEDDINEILTPSISILSSDGGSNFTGRKNLIHASTTDLSGTDTNSSLQQNILLEDSTENENKQNDIQVSIQNTNISVPNNTPKYEDSSRIDNYEKVSTSAECKKSINKIYDLMKKITVSPINPNNKPPTIANINNLTKENITSGGIENTIIQHSDSGTSVKLHSTISNLSSFSFDKVNPVVEATNKLLSKNTETSTTVIPKVVISSKVQPEKRDIYKIKKENRKADSKITENPLKAISQLLHEFENVQKTRHKNGKAQIEENGTKHVAFKNVSHNVKNQKDNEQRNLRFFKPSSPIKISKLSQQSPRGDKPLHKQKLADIIDEVKEMRGEAVRGPSKRLSRIDNLAQPKKSYVQAHREDFQNRYSKNFISRVQKTITPSIQEKNKKTNDKNRNRGDAETPSGITKQLNKIGHSLEKPVKSKRSANNSPTGKEKRVPVSANILPDKVNNDPDSLKKKMVAVETYLKNHFGRDSPTYKIGYKNLQKSRVPLIPTDIDLGSITSSPLEEESTTLGNRLHNMINSKITTNNLASNACSEYKELAPEIVKSESIKSVENLLKCGTTTSTSDHPVDIFEDKNIITAVACVSKEDNDYKTDRGKSKEVDVAKHEEQKLINNTHNHISHNELQKLENALYRQMSTGNFQKRLRIKNLTLTPKQSTKQVFLLQSGDAQSLVVKSTSQKLNFSKTDTISKLNILPVMSRNAITFNLPMQIATVGYVFPTYRTIRNNINNEENHLVDNDFAPNLHTITSKNNKQVDKTVQCFKGSNKHNTDIDINTVCSKEFFDVPKETKVEQEIITPFIQEKTLPKDISNDKYETENVRIKNSDNISNTTSLDILVGLLNEIKKITTCQSNLVKSVNETDTCLESKELKVILNNSAVQDNSEDYSVKSSISILSLDNQINMHPSNFSLHVHSNFDDYIGKYKFRKHSNTNMNVNCGQSLFSDKEVSVEISSKEFAHRFTDAPSRFFPITINRSTEVIKSLITIVNKTSNESVSSFPDCHLLYSNSTFNNIEASPPNKSQSLASKTEVKKIRENIINENKTKNILNVIKPKNHSIINNAIKRRNLGTLQEFDPLIKMKRDMLVTVYSILVITVFAALTIPEIIYLA